LMVRVRSPGLFAPALKFLSPPMLAGDAAIFRMLPC
jgi:hypothetical protein